jgi:hypothetical protein
MTQIIDHVISALAQVKKELMEKIAGNGEMISFLQTEWLPKNWEEEEPETRSLDDTTTPADAAYRGELIDRAAVTWESLSPATQQAIVTAVRKLDPGADVEQLEALWVPPPMGAS